jgi:hypothetical protein
MDKDVYYFPHDCNARNDNKIIAIRIKHGAEGYGVYFMIIEKLRESADYKCVKDYNIIAFDLRVDALVVKSVVEDFGLFAFAEDGKCFYSESLLRRMIPMDELRKKRSDAGKLGMENRWKSTDLQQTYNSVITDLQQIDNNKSKVNKNREKESKEKVKESKVKPPNPQGGDVCDCEVFDELSFGNNESNTGDLSKDFHQEGTDLSLGSGKSVTSQKNDNIEIVMPVDESSFENVWLMYGKKGNKKTSAKKWANLKNHCREAALKHIPLYVQSTPNVQYRKNFETYINQECWNDEIITKNHGAERITITKDGAGMGFSNPGNGANTFRTDADRRKYEREMLKQVSTAVLQQREAKDVQ